MSVVATSPIAIAKAALRRLVASSAQFQSVVGAISEAAAMDRVHIVEAIDDESEDTEQLADPRPRCLIDMAGFSAPLVGVGEYQDQYEFALSFEFPPPESITGGVEGAHLRDESTWFDNQWGQIIEEMKANNGLRNADDEPYFYFTAIELAGGPNRNNPDEDPVRQYLWGVELAVSGPHG